MVHTGAPQLVFSVCKELTFKRDFLQEALICEYWHSEVDSLQLKVHYCKLIHTRLCKLFQCQD